MAVQVFAFAPVIPAGTLITAPVTINLAMPPRIVRRIEWQVPPGPAGLMGWALAAAGQNMIPVNANAWIITNDEKGSWDVDSYLTSGAWQLRGYNGGLFDHTVFVRFHCDLVQTAQGTPAPAPIPIEQLSPFSADDLAALTNDTLSADAIASLADVPLPDASALGVE